MKFEAARASLRARAGACHGWLEARVIVLRSSSVDARVHSDLLIVTRTDASRPQSNAHSSTAQGRQFSEAGAMCEQIECLPQRLGRPLLQARSAHWASDMHVAGSMKTRG
jgi:hypothetical protein